MVAISRPLCSRSTALAWLEAPDLGNEDGVMPHEMSPGKPSTRRYSQAEKDRAVRAVRQLRKELGAEYGTRKRVADQLRIGVESLRSWVKQAEIDDVCLVGQQRSQCCANDVQRNRESQRQPEPAPEHLQVGQRACRGPGTRARRGVPVARPDRGRGAWPDCAERACRSKESSARS